MSNRAEYVNDPAAPKATTIVPASGGAVFDSDGRLLLVRRADNGRWAIPGGRNEPGESIHETVCREILEETGLSVKVTRIVGAYSNPHYVIAYADGEVRQQFFLLCRCELISGSLKSDAQTSDVGFFSKDETAALPLSPGQEDRIADAFADRAEAVIR